MLETQLAYLAGLIDGEGSITLYLRKGSELQFRLAVYNTDEAVIDWLVITFGGSKYKVGRRQNIKHSQEYQWFVACSDASAILSQVLPYLIIKLAKAKVAIEAWQNRQPIPRSERREPIPQALIRSRESYITAFHNTN